MNIPTNSLDYAEGHGGQLVVSALQQWGVNEIFTLSGGHVFPIYDACVKSHLPIYDVRHEQSAAFGAEGIAKLLRRPGVCVVTAGPGVTNSMSAIASAQFNGSPLVVIAGRSPQARWGQGSLQEIDHIPFISPITKSAYTATNTSEIFPLVENACNEAMTVHRGPTFVDIPIDVIYSNGIFSRSQIPESWGEKVNVSQSINAEQDQTAIRSIEEVARLIVSSRKPLLVAGGDVWMGSAEDQLKVLVERFQIPTFLNGQGRGILSFDHPLCLTRTRSMLAQAELVVVVGTPLDFRLSFGRFGDAQVVHIVDHYSRKANHLENVITLHGDIKTTLIQLLEDAERYVASFANSSLAHKDRQDWATELRELESKELESDSEIDGGGTIPIHPVRIFRELAGILDRDAIVVGDGGDFVSFAGKYVRSYEPGCWLDPGPYGCLGTSMGYLMAARIAHPTRQVVGVIGDGAFGFSAMDVDSLVRLKLPVVMVVGNNGIWGLEKHPMKALYGYDVAADLQSECRYDQIITALGGAGEIVRDPNMIGEAITRGFDSGVPYLVNVITDPNIVYPRSSNLA